jgi:hypothetical protein
LGWAEVFQDDRASSQRIGQDLAGCGFGDAEYGLAWGQDKGKDVPKKQSLDDEARMTRTKRNTKKIENGLLGCTPTGYFVQWK